MELPLAGQKRWSARQKATVVRAIRNGELSAADARQWYMLSEEELANWFAAYDRHGLSGLQVKSMRHRRG